MLKMFKIFAGVGLILGVLSQPAMARDFGTIYTECGIGAMVAPTAPGAAAVTNIIWDYGSTAITSNISSPETCRGGQEKMATFIHDSYESLENDLASGSGEYLDLLVSLIGDNSHVKQSFVKVLRKDFSTLVADESYTDQNRFEKAEALYNLVYKHVGGIS